MLPFSDKVEGMVNDEVTIGATVVLTTNKLYFDGLYNTSQASVRLMMLTECERRFVSRLYLPQVIFSSSYMFNR